MVSRKTALGAFGLLLLAASLPASNVFVFPTFVDTPTGSASVLRGNPLVQAGTFTSTTDVFTVLAKPTAAPNDVKYYVISRTGSNSVQILNSTFQPIGQSISLGQTVTAAEISPDGRRLVVIAGNNLRVFNTDTDTEIQATQAVDVGPTPSGIAFRSDSRRAFVISPTAQRVTAVDLVDLRTDGEIPLPGITAGNIAASPNGFIYVNTQGRVLEIDPRATPLTSNAVRRQFPIQNSNVGKLHFTPDGTRALAVNIGTQSNQLIFFFTLTLSGGGVTSINTTQEGFSGFVFDKIVVAGNNRAYVTTTSNSVNPRKLYELAIPPVPGQGEQQGVPGIAEAFFGSLGSIPIIDNVNVSGEIPSSLRLFISAPLRLLNPNAANTIYVADLTQTTPNVFTQLSLNFLPAFMGFAGPAGVQSENPVSGILRFNAAQQPIAPSGRTLPFGVQLVGVTGQPVFNVPITFSSPTAGVSFEPAGSANSNSLGQVFATLVAPATPGDINVNVAVGGSGLGSSFAFTVGAPGGGGGGGPGGAGGITVVSGDGQIVREGNFSPNPMVVRVLGADGKPAGNVTVTWTITQGGGNLRLGDSVDGAISRTTTTDANGLTSNEFIAPFNLSLGVAFLQSVISASTANSTATIFVTTMVAFQSGFQTPNPSVNFLAPTSEPLRITGRVGQTITDAIRLQITSSAIINFGAVLPNVGIFPATENDPAAGPVVACVPKPVPLSNEAGIVSCDLRISGRAGTGAVIRLNIGGFSDRVIFLDALPGEPGNLTIISGNNQQARAGDTLQAPLVVELDDGGGNRLPGAQLRWTIVPQGAATLLGNNLTTTDGNGRASNTIRLGSTPGAVQVVVSALGGNQPTVTFDARAVATLAQFNKVSGDNQTTFTGANFSNPLVVQVLDNRGAGVPGQAITFTVASGGATLTAASVNTDSTGRAQVGVRAGANPGPIVINAAVAGLPGLTFNLTAQLPGPTLNPLDFFNAASGERGAVVPGSLYVLSGLGIAEDLRGCVTANTILGPLPTRLSNVEVQFGATLAPLINVCNISGRQSITLQVPFELVPGVPVAVTVRVGSGSTVVNGVSVIGLQPGIFETVDGQNRRYAVALRPNGSFVTPDNPARYGEIIRFFVTGAGQVSPSAFTNVTGVAGQNIIAPAAAGINDAGVRLVSATYMLGNVGVFEIAIEVPTGTTTGASRPLGFFMNQPNGQVVFTFNSPVIAIAP
ncbi:MAG: hypothetical protein FJW20_13695 [Acidimicrobiia bacterium]|nr:hypothetical protein [Acidimicrobiia bacterium]